MTTGEAGIGPVDRSAEVYATVQHRGREVRVRGVLLGKLVRVQGKPLAAEVEVMEGNEDVPIGRVTLVPIKHVNAANDAALARLLGLL